MPNAARHIVGAAVGLIAFPLLVLGVTETMALHFRAITRFEFGAGGPLLWLLLLVVVGMLIGGLVGPRVSPLASLIPGVLLVLFSAAASTVGETASLISDIYGGPNILTSTPALGVLGGLLIAASLFPSRWRAAPPANASGYPPPGYPASAAHGPQQGYAGPGHDAGQDSYQYGGPGPHPYGEAAPSPYGEPGQGYGPGAPR
ncbi:hypothetical protein CLV63_107167 [Murinocardiopsis flavida]|uniref:Uncharacterized protein n=1 Tax=Murinocardiopsis flavida TaxID=645275 RepID=A0A2P8DKN1_9ACTN|nr:hypothetical protein [Murinocardiopsis flavida]PSK97774.1 hypothetical protein CLV63_107167 [Murinocardiopsis flavida]